MTQRRENPAAGAISLALSLCLAAVLLAMTVSADSGRPAQPPASPPDVAGEEAAEPHEPDLGVVVLPPPPVTVAVAEPPAPANPPPAAPEPPAPEPLAPEPVVQKVIAPKPPPRPQIAARQPPQPQPAPAEITPEAVREGRALLRLLENGAGPDIEIAWPAAARDRADLYRRFNACFGMRTVVMSTGGEMYSADGDRFDADRYSGFVRQPAGGLSAGEQAQVDAIRRRHGLLGGSVLRLFPRRVDAILLGALDRIAGGDFDRGSRIRARYRAVASGIEVADIRIDGRAANENIVLPYSALRTC